MHLIKGIFTDKRIVHPIAWKRYRTRFLQVPQDLLGISITFHHMDRKVTISLPNADVEKLFEDFIKPSEERTRVHLLGWREDKTGKKHPYLTIRDVEVEVDVVEKVTIHREMRRRPPNQRDLLTEIEQDHLDEICNRYRSIAVSAFEKWMRVLRWKSKDGSIGMPAVAGNDANRSTYLVLRGNKKRVWSGISHVSLVLKKSIPASSWYETEKALLAGFDSPLHWNLFFEATEAYAHGDKRRAVIDLAVSSEVFLRTKLSESLPRDLSQPAREYLEEMHIRPLMTKHFPLLLSPDGSKVFDSIASTLHQLFDLRNDIVHYGALDKLQPDKVSTLKDAVTSLLELEEVGTYWL